MQKELSLCDYYNHRSFMASVHEKLKEIHPDTYCITAIDIEHFRLFNKMYGRDAGNQLIYSIISVIWQAASSHDGISGYFGADNFALFLPDDSTLINSLREQIIRQIQNFHASSGFYPVIGIYSIDDTTLSPEIMYDRATLALTHAIKQPSRHICRYIPDMEERLEKEVILLSEIQAAIQNNEFTFFAQPQCDISTGKIVGAEALVRWQKPDGTLVSPGVFIPVLENNGMIDQLDSIIWEKVFRWLRSWIDLGHSPVPISINVSRIDILSMDVPQFIFSLLEKYNLPERLIKIEITESAYTENNDSIIATVDELRSHGFKVMMDDFGCGYSSLNMLRTIPVDVLKLDMRFLDIDENEEEKGINILESVVNMARLLRLPIVVEGVETERQEKFVQNLGCRYTQGFYYYKPLPIEKFESLLKDERHLDHQGLLYKQVEPLHIREFVDHNFFSDSMLNNMIGPIAFYEMYDNQIEITRINEQYFRLSSSTALSQEGSYGKRFWNHVMDTDRALLYTTFEQAYADPIHGAENYIHFHKTDGTVLLIYFKVFFLKEKDGRRQFYGSLTDATDLLKKYASQTTVSVPDSHLPDHPENYFDHLPGGFSINKLHLDENGKPVSFDLIYANDCLRKVCNGDIKQLKSLCMHPFLDHQEEILDHMYRAAYEGKTVTFSMYSHISNRYLKFEYFQYRPGYVASIMLDVTHSYLSEQISESILHAYREVYFIHLKDNSVRMLHPDENNVLARGNYEEMINRHFQAGKIQAENEAQVRQFLSLQNLRSVLLGNDTTQLSYQRTVPGSDSSLEWCLTKFNVLERDTQNRPVTALMLIQSTDH